MPAAAAALSAERAAEGGTGRPTAAAPLRPRPPPPWPAQDITPEEFAERFERPRLPVVITGLMDGWGAARGWTIEELLRRFRDHKFKVGARRGASQPRTPSRGQPLRPHSSPARPSDEHTRLRLQAAAPR
jgi:hypothetical protein